MSEQRRIALYGGTFDPVHKGHTAVAHALSEMFALDLVIFIPAYVAPHKRVRQVTPALHRYAMLALATQEEPQWHVSTIELDAPERPFTFETLSRMRESFEGDVRLFFVMGADSWMEITTWREWEQVLSLSDHIVITRPGYDLSAEHVTPQVRERIIDLRGAVKEHAAVGTDRSGGAKIYVTDAVNMDISATAIRRAVKDGRDADWLKYVRSPVANYIRKYGLYKEA
jgi:nicotinate-nucleotide adenylyltransferase